MEPAPELEEFTRQILAIFQSKEAELFIESFSRHECVLAIGTELDEWWEGYDVITAAFNTQLAEMPPFAISIEHISAWKQDTIGWMSMRGAIEVEGASTPVRCTMIWRKEGAYWKITNFHFSGTLSNEEILGRTLTTSFDELVALLKDEPPPLSVAASDGSVTIVFTDIEGSTALMESLGEAEWTSMLAWHDEHITSQTSAFGGIVVKGQGDGFMLAFPAPGAATACAVAIQRTLASGWNGVPVPVRIGVHSGNAREESGDFFGRTVIIAARVASAAAGREILVSQDVQSALGGAFALGEPETLRLKGLGGEFTVFPVTSR